MSANRGHPSANLLRRRQPRAPADKFLRHIFGLRREDVFPQPLVERHVVTATRAAKSSGHCVWPIDESRQHELPAGIDGLRRGILRFDVRPRSYRHDGCRPITATAPSSTMRRSHSS